MNQQKDTDLVIKDTSFYRCRNFWGDSNNFFSISCIATEFGYRGIYPNVKNLRHTVKHGSLEIGTHLITLKTMSIVKSSQRA
jgi:hypothetical protein